MPRRKQKHEHPDLGEYELSDLLDQLLQGGLDSTASAILDLAKRAGLTLLKLRKRKTEAISFAGAS